jgi:cell division protein FtsB
MLCLLAFLYFKPARTYLAKRHQLAVTHAEVVGLRAEQQRLRRLVAASSSDAELAREARRLGLVLPGERLFIVKGIQRWLKQHPATVAGDG